VGFIDKKDGSDKTGDKKSDKNGLIN